MGLRVWEDRCDGGFSCRGGMGMHADSLIISFCLIAVKAVK